jgi:ketosteroid isomerase-like protein
MRRVLIAAAVLMLTVPGVSFGRAGGDNSAGGKSKAEREVLKLLDGWLDALKRSDMAALDRIIADDFTIVGTEGAIRSKEQDLAPIKSGDLKFESLATEDVKVFVYGDTAVVTGIGTYKVNFKGRAADVRERFFDVYQKRKGRWQVIASRSTPAEKRTS